MIKNKTKRLLVSILLTIILFLGIGQNIVNAQEDRRNNPITFQEVYGNRYTDLTNKNGKEYKINGRTIYQIISKNSSTGDITAINNIYCLDPNAGIGGIKYGEQNYTGILNYSVGFDMVTETENIMSAGDIYSNTVNPEIYNQIMWIMDNMYIDGGDLTIEQLMKNAGLKYGISPNYDHEDGGALRTREIWYCLDFDGNTINETWHWGKIGYSYTDNNGDIQDVLLSKEDIEAVQEAALWYFTKYELKGDNSFDGYTYDTPIDIYGKNPRQRDTSGSNFTLKAQNTHNSPFEGVEIVTGDGQIDQNIQRMKQEQAAILYNYFVDGAKAAVQNGYEPDEEATLNFEYEENAENKEEVIENGITYIKVGPVVTTKTGTVNNIVLKEVKTGINHNTNINLNKVILKDKETNQTITTITPNNGFYVLVPKDDIQTNTIKITVSGTGENTKKTLWTVQNNNETQPIVVVERESENLEKSLTATLEETPNFDLALRKQIIAVNGKSTAKDIVNEKEVDARRTVNIDESTIPDTAKYQHRKDPVVVKTNDTVTYRLHIYNEGELDGYASKIIDKLADGLTISSTMRATVTSKNGNIYNVEYNQATNEIILTLFNTNTIVTAIQAYTSGDPKEDYIDIVCEVTQNAETDANRHYLTNIAYIAESYKVIEGTATKITERDRNNTESLINNTNTTNGTNGLNIKTKSTDYISLNDEIYHGSTSNNIFNNTNNNTDYFAGQEDDDDFETVVVMPKEFDLKLIKYISQVNGENVYEENYRIVTVDTTNLKPNGTKQTTADYDVSKVPVVVDTGDYVTYTFRIYNEGEVSGYAEEITEDIPNGLEYVYDNRTIAEIQNDTTLSEKEKQARIFNKGQGWGEQRIEDGIKLVSTNYLSSSNVRNLIEAYDGGEELDYKEVSIILKVTETDPTKIVRNEAAITDDSDEFGNDVEDRDSTPEDWDKEDSNDDYKNNPDYPKYVEDDEDYDNIRVLRFDLSLRKFISKVSTNGDFDNAETTTIYDGSQDTREPDVDTSKLGTTGANEKIISTAEYNHTKEPIIVNVGDYILYTIRVYNEGETDGYAKQIKDYLPLYLDFVSGTRYECNKYWQYDPETRIVTTNTEPEQQVPQNYTKKLKAFDGTTLDYAEVQIVCRVNENARRPQTNIAEISIYHDKNDEPRDKDFDSQPDNLEYPVDASTYKDDEIGTKPYIPGQQDDDDFEKVIIREPNKYSLVLVKEDENGEDLNSKAIFEVKVGNGAAQTKEVTGRLIIAENVEINNSNVLTPDVYVIKETKAPDEYCEFGGIITITVTKGLSENGTTYEVKSVDYAVTDENGNDITSEVGEDVNVHLNKDGNIYVEVKDYEDITPHKGVKTVENQDSGYDIDEEQAWVITSEIPTDIAKYKKYVITDDIDYRLVFQGKTKVEVKIGNVTLTQGTDYKVEFTENANGVSQKTTSRTLQLVFVGENQTVSNKLTANTDKDIEITFKTKFAKDANGNLLAKIGEDVNNKAILEYTNGSNVSKEKETEEPEVHTGGVTLFKYYASGENKVALEGAEFAIYRSEEDALNRTNAVMTAKSDAKGIVRFIGLEFGEDAKNKESNKTANGTYEYNSSEVSTNYWVVETKTPKGYRTNLTAPIKVTVNATSYKETGIVYQVENEKLNFDLALRKFITDVSGKAVTTRIPRVEYNEGKISYTHPKDVLKVHVDDIVTYTLRVYNEGDIDGFAQTISDDIPDYLEFLPENDINKQYRWIMYDKDGKVTTEVKDAVKIVSDYTSKENGEELMKADTELTKNPNLLKAFNSKAEISDTNPSFVDVKVAFKVIDPDSNKIVITNKAQISEDADEDGEPVDDIDSTPDEWIDEEDDQDFENVAVEYFDLALLKYVSKVFVTEDQKTTTTNTGNTGAKTDIIPKVEINKKKINTTVVKFEYVIKITNEGDIAGYAKEITDYVPEGLKFYSEDNSGWKDEGNNVISTKLLENILLQPGESASVKVILRWINGESNLQTKINIAEISEDYNDKDVPDKDSTPDNKKEGEDDIDDAPVLLTIKTGMEGNPMLIIGTSFAMLVLFGTGIVLIKKYVL